MPPAPSGSRGCSSLTSRGEVLDPEGVDLGDPRDVGLVVALGREGAGGEGEGEGLIDLTEVGEGEGLLPAGGVLEAAEEGGAGVLAQGLGLPGEGEGFARIAGASADLGEREQGVHEQRVCGPKACSARVRRARRACSASAMRSRLRR
jgi:hypothetical protein